MKRALPLLLALSAGSAMAQSRVEPLSVDLGGQVRFAAAGRSMAERRFATVVRQQLDFSCGSAALATLLGHHYGQAIDERMTFLGMWRGGDQPSIRRLGFSLLDMKRYMAERGVPADGYRVTLDQIAKAGRPGIALINFRGYQHFVVVKRVVRDAVLLGDPSLGLRWERRGRFVEQWNGVFFVVNRPLPASAAGDMALDLSFAPRFDLNAAHPLDRAGLLLTRPVQGGM